MNYWCHIPFFIALGRERGEDGGWGWWGWMDGGWWCTWIFSPPPPLPHKHGFGLFLSTAAAAASTHFWQTFYAFRRPLIAWSFVCRGAHAHWAQGVDGRDATLPFKAGWRETGGLRWFLPEKCVCCWFETWSSLKDHVRENLCVKEALCAWMTHRTA